MVGIYKITNPSGSVYIGLSWDIKVRFNRYRRLNCHQQRHIYSSLKKYGPESHTFDILHELPSDINQSTLSEYERIYWDFYNSLGFKMMNLKEPGDGGRLSEETKRIIGLKNKGKGGKLKQGLKDPKGAKTRSGTGHHSYKGEVYCFNADGKFVQIFITIGDAAHHFRVTCNDIRRVITGDRNHLKGFVFNYSGNEPNPIVINDVSKKMVLDPVSGVIYKTIAEAGRAIGMHSKTLAHQLKGERSNKSGLILKVA
jgi:group I intron endonuclease